MDAQPDHKLAECPKQETGKFGASEQVEEIKTQAEALLELLSPKGQKLANNLDLGRQLSDLI